MSKIRVFLARTQGVKIGPNSRIASNCDIGLGMESCRRGKIQLGTDTELSPGVVIHPYGGTVTMGKCCFIGPSVVIYGHGDVTIGDECLIAMHCRILSSEHSQPPSDVSIRSQADVKKSTRLGRDVWLGAGVTILGGVTVGDGCIIGASAVVTGDLPPFSIAIGQPARVVGQRK